MRDRYPRQQRLRRSRLIRQLQPFAAAPQCCALRLGAHYRAAQPVSC